MLSAHTHLLEDTLRKYPLFGLAVAGLLTLSACGMGNAPQPQASPDRSTEKSTEKPSEEATPTESETGDVIDNVVVEDSIAETLEDVTGVSPDTVKCPENVAIEAGSTFQCSVDIEGQTLLMDVMQENDEGDLTYAEADNQIILSDTEITDELTEAAYSAVENGDLSVPETSEVLVGTCVFPKGEEVYIARVGENLDCAIADQDGNNILVMATVEADGTLSYEWAE